MQDSSSITQFQSVFQSQWSAFSSDDFSSRKNRLRRLKIIKEILEDEKESLLNALQKDLGRNPSESTLLEWLPTYSEVKHAIGKLSEWMEVDSVDTPLQLLGSSSKIYHEPKGVTLIIAPWNYPLNLVLAPLISSLAAGNTAVIKPSEFAIHTSILLKEIIEKYFKPSEVTLILGGVEETTALLSMPFHHIFFTGSTRVGSIVMQAAAKHLTSVTLELGGKSPALLLPDADVKRSAFRIAWGKFVNCGQTCIAPDFVYLHESQKELFLKHLESAIKSFYGDGPMQENVSYGRIIHQDHLRRLITLKEEAVANGANICIDSGYDEQDKYMGPCILSEVPWECTLMKEEIFGPILPVLTYTDLSKATENLWRMPSPLAFYVFGRSTKSINTILKNSKAGGSCVNDCMLHYANPDLPFGGVQNSGIGKCHGYFGYKEFSNARAVFRQNLWASTVQLFYPPYSPLKKRLMNWVSKIV